MADNDFRIVLEGFNEGFAPLAHIDDKTFIGNKGQASVMLADILSKPGFVTQSPGIADLTNGNQAGNVTELIRFILDKPTAADTTYAIGTSKLFKLSSTAVNITAPWPQSVTGMTSGESVIRLKANIYGFYNKASGGDILKMDLATETVTAGWGSSTDQALEDALHPAAVKEDIMLFGNGRYVGAYIEGLATLNVQKLDFGEGSEVADIVFNGGVWWIAVNTGDGERTQGQIYTYDGSALSNILLDEAGLGVQKIGFLYVVNGIIYVCYEELTSNSYILGYLQGRQMKPLRYFTGTLPDHRQKTLYKNTILFTSDDSIWSCGAVVDQLPIQISKLADGGYATLGGIAAPFGTPMIASTDNGSNYRLAKFSGYDTASSFKSNLIDITNGKNLGRINTIIVATKALGANASCALSLEGNQGAKTSSGTLTIDGTGATRHVFQNIGLGAVEDIRVCLDWSGGNTTNDCPIRKITLEGSYVER